jgi:hypothetical protein
MHTAATATAEMPHVRVHVVDDLLLARGSTSCINEAEPYTTSTGQLRGACLMQALLMHASMHTKQHG